MASSNDNQSNPKFSFDLNIPNPPNEQHPVEIDGSIPVTITQTTSHGTRLLDLNMEPGCESPILELDVDGLQEEEDFEFPILGFDNDEDLIPTPNSTPNPEILYCDSGSGSSGFWDPEMIIGFEEKPEHNNNICYDNGALVENAKKKVDNKGGRKLKNGSGGSSALSRETISEYFYMPITQAARELNVGLTLLKKRCRDLGIRGWPRRKLISLQTLIKNVQELDREGSSPGEGSKLSEYLRVLEQEKKMLEEIPEMRLKVGTKRLRQDIFKANYKKRNLLG